MLKTVQYFLQNCFVLLQNKLYILFQKWEIHVQKLKLLLINVQKQKCNNHFFWKIMNVFKFRLLVIVLLMEINEHQRSKERRRSHDTNWDIGYIGYL